jgi:hypothetical protein
MKALFAVFLCCIASILPSLLMTRDSRWTPSARQVVSSISMAIDEGHFNVRTMDGSYRPFTELAKTAGIKVWKHVGPFTATSLSHYDVLVIGLARGAGNEFSLEDRGRPAFNTDEIEVLLGWVRAGGALLLVIDHWPTGGANAGLAGAFGVDVMNGSTNDSLLFDHSTQTIVFDRRSGAIANHPITCGRTTDERIDRLATFTGTSLRGPPGSSPLLIFSTKAIDLMGPERKERSAWGRSQGLALKFAEGRVVILGEAAMLRVFDDPSVQNRQFAKNLIVWLAGDLTAESATGCIGID